MLRDRVSQAIDRGIADAGEQRADYAHMLTIITDHVMDEVKPLTTELPIAPPEDISIYPPVDGHRDCPG